MLSHRGTQALSERLFRFKKYLLAEFVFKVISKVAVPDFYQN